MKIEISPISYETSLNWYDAVLYCFALNIDGKTGWRLPTNEEQEFLNTPDIECSTEWYWTSTCDGNFAICYNWYSDMGSFSHKKYVRYVRPVRDLKDN